MSDSPLPADELRRLVEADGQRRVQAVQAMIQTALNEHNCELQAVPHIVDGRIVAHIVIVPTK
jgi:hypothetical protein